ncbi:NAD(P)-binding domain-containing protein [Nocardia sp. XZ_19_385]|uniref:NAD(P)-binding domain-containing protein n=1 Tax=Nocardia sp. XZ_19_385 TaxID=2769488 RepID=UPI00188E3907|nr:NAD(P)-binding domain-containing protein [Nocardia sp. XZ_19_385]
MTDSPIVAVLGAGIMANTAAGVLDAHGYQLRRYNRNPDAIEGPAVVCASPAQAAEGAAAVWSFVHDDSASRASWFGPRGALGAAAGTLVIESSTLSPQAAQRWMDEAVRAGAHPVLAAMTGSRVGVQNGTLLVFAAGTTAALHLAEPLLSVVACEVLHFDQAAGAATAKLLNNALAAAILAALSETLTATATFGLDQRQLIDAWSRHGWAAPVTSAYGEAMRAGDHPLTDCSLRVIAKDLRYLRNAFDTPVPPLIEEAAARFAQAAAQGLGECEMSAIIESDRGTP